MRNIVYLTFNDAPGGIFTSQVIDVCNFLQREFMEKVTLVSFVSMRGYWNTRRRIRAQYPSAIVLPMWPGVKNWKKNTGFLRRRLRKLNPAVIIARGPFATILAKAASDAKICFDGRGAYTAEFSEYNVSGNQIDNKAIRQTEADAIEQADCIIAVSEALVNYWKTEFKYTGDKHVIIPCTLAHQLLPVAPPEKRPSRIRIVFSGGNGKWQSLHLISGLLIPCFESNPDVELVMLTSSLPEPFPLKEKFPDRVEQEWVHESEVQAIFASCDYGWMVRDDTVTNRVASPVKFAEYLVAGLPVIISDHLGDFSDFVRQHGCGIVLEKKSLPVLKKLSDDERAANRKLAIDFFVKSRYINEYAKCIE